MQNHAVVTIGNTSIERAGLLGRLLRLRGLVTLQNDAYNKRLLISWSARGIASDMGACAPIP
jgi:hypothetical protein